MVRFLGTILLLSGLLFALPVHAETCSTDGEHKVCLISIKRSAKYYWEYRVVLKVDGKQRISQTIDCWKKKPSLHGYLPTGTEDYWDFVCNIVPKR